MLRTQVLLALIGAVVGFFVLFERFQAGIDVPVYRAWLALGGGVGTVLSVHLTRDGFGRPGMWGGVQAILSACIATLAAGVIGGTIALPIFGTMFGPWLLVVSFVQAPLLFVPWAGGLLMIHWAYAKFRAERETIFR